MNYFNKYFRETDSAGTVEKEALSIFKQIAKLAHPDFVDDPEIIDLYNKASNIKDIIEGKEPENNIRSKDLGFLEIFKTIRERKGELKRILEEVKSLREKFDRRKDIRVEETELTPVKKELTPEELKSLKTKALTYEKDILLLGIKNTGLAKAKVEEARAIRKKAEESNNPEEIEGILFRLGRIKSELKEIIDNKVSIEKESGVEAEERAKNLFQEILDEEERMNSLTKEEFEILLANKALAPKGVDTDDILKFQESRKQGALRTYDYYQETPGSLTLSGLNSLLTDHERGFLDLKEEEIMDVKGMIKQKKEEENPEEKSETNKERSFQDEFYQILEDHKDDPEIRKEELEKLLERIDEKGDDKNLNLKGRILEEINNIDRSQSPETKQGEDKDKEGRDKQKEQVEDKLEGEPIKGEQTIEQYLMKLSDNPEVQEKLKTLFERILEKALTVESYQNLSRGRIEEIAFDLTKEFYLDKIKNE